MYTNILIPTDGSDLSGKAVHHGIALAERGREFLVNAFAVHEHSV